MSSFLNWTVNEEPLARNPARGLRLPDPINKRDKRSPFDRDQLHAIFNAPLYRGCVDGERGYNKVGSQRPRNARFWVPLIALFIGARLGEICQLDTTDIRAVDGVDCVVISLRSLVGSTDKQLKTTASDRLIPIHPVLIDCGLTHFAEAQRKAGETKPFDDIETGSTGSRPVAFSKWFTQFLRACGAQRPRTSFHSFRHNFRDELRAARIEHDIALHLGGWTTGSSRSANPDAILLDLGLPDRDGLEIVQLLRQTSPAPLLVISARDATEQKVAALDLGADDYVTKPFDSEEVLARLRVSLRQQVRSQGAAPVVQAGPVTIDVSNRAVRRGAEEVHLTRKEFEVLRQLALTPGRVVTHQRIIAAAWPDDEEQRVDYLRIVVRNLRQKLEPDPSRPSMILNELGIGCRLSADG